VTLTVNDGGGVGISQKHGPCISRHGIVPSAIEKQTRLN
jgi:hypothetical protein